MRLPIRTKLTLVFAVLMVAVLSIAGAIVYYAYAAQLDREIDQRITALADELATDLENGETQILRDFGEGDSEGFFAQLLNGNGSIAEKQDVAPNPLLVAAELDGKSSGQLFERKVISGPGQVSQLARLAVAGPTGGRYVIVGAPLAGRNAALNKLGLLLGAAGPILAIVASLLAWLLAGAALRPVESLRQQAALISESALGSRLPVPDTGDEIAMLATTLNDMLARLETAFEREHRFVDDASHELRTPLGVLKTELDLALRRARTKEELEAALASASEESERLNRIAEDLLVLARADRGKLPLQKKVMEAAPLLQRIVARFARKAEQQGVEMELAVAPKLDLCADAPRLEQAIGNLIANALSYAPRGGKIAVKANADGGKAAIISVSDNGPGFPAAFISSAFDPFTRADPARSRSGGGVGLGLAIVKGVAEAHGGSVSAGNRPGGGAIVSIRLPM